MNSTTATKTNDTSCQKIVLKYARPDLSRSIWQVVNSLVPYIITWFLMYKSLSYPYWVTLLLAIPASGFLIRLFIIFHDCGHGSFYRSKKASNITGIITGILSFTPYLRWHSQHAIHHATAANLDKRGIGDLLTYTVDEYLQASKWNRFVYRAFRNPFIMFTIGPVYMILIQNRLTNKDMTREEKYNVYLTNAAILLIASLLSLLMGIKAFLLIQVPVIYFSHVAGLWLFYIQHQFDPFGWQYPSEYLNS
jgi:omega-6 fatty acid desaturase (delta-12 desaturase)